MNAVFGKYQLIKQIGGGKLSEVFSVARRGETRSINVALKRVLPALIGGDEFVRLVVREAGVLTRIDHPGLCVCHEIGVIDGCAFFTLDLVTGCTLRAMMRRLSALQSPLPNSALVALLHQLASVLDYLHRYTTEPLVHADLSPQNVMISNNGTVKLIDFGIARYLSGRDAPPLAGRIAGTVGYMSPEQASGLDDLDPRADQYGLGILLWEMCCGSRLFAGNTAETWRRMRQGEILEEPPLAMERPEELLTLMHQLLAPRANQRYDHMGHVIAALERLTSSVESGTRPLGALVSHLLKDDDFDPFDYALARKR